MSVEHPATWQNGKRKIKGTWTFNRASDRFTIWLNSRDRITGVDRVVVTAGNKPEWGNWKLVPNDMV